MLYCERIIIFCWTGGRGVSREGGGVKIFLSNYWHCNTVSVFIKSYKCFKAKVKFSLIDQTKLAISHQSLLRALNYRIFRDDLNLKTTLIHKKEVKSPFCTDFKLLITIYLLILKVGVRSIYKDMKEFLYSLAIWTWISLHS